LGEFIRKNFKLEEIYGALENSRVSFSQFVKTAIGSSVEYGRATTN